MISFLFKFNSIRVYKIHMNVTYMWNFILRVYILQYIESFNIIFTTALNKIHFNHVNLYM